MSVISSEKAMRSIRHNSSLANPCWLLQITFLSFVCWERTSKSIYFITSPGTEVMLIGLNFNFPHSVSPGCIPPTKPLPASVSGVPPSHGPAQSEAPCLLLPACCHACPTSCTWEWKVLALPPWRPTSSSGHLYSPGQLPESKWSGQDLPFWSSGW